jgi:four helix bundle protein
MGDYRKLEVWVLACTVADRMDELFELLPARLQKTIGDQLVRAADSPHLNIAEGCGLNSDPQLAKHVRYGLGSVNELESGLLKLRRRGRIPESHLSLLDDCTLLRKKLGAFLKTLTSEE